jgi:lysophospholipase L1-like esterase
MHKQVPARVVAAIVVIIIALLSVVNVRADDPMSWTSSSLSAQKQADVLSVPTTLGGNGNIDCSMEDPINCSLPTTYGTATQNGSVRLSSSSLFLPVITFVDNRQHFLPVPNSNEAISYFSGPPYGLDLAFNYNFTSSVIKSAGALQITKAPDGKLTDKAKHLLAADTSSMAFSENGRWLVVSDPNVAMLRVNLQTFEVLPFAPGLNYTIGLDPAVKMSVTNDGRYAVVASKNFNTFKIYDLNTCGTVPDTINSSVSCQSRDLGAFMQQALPVYSFTAQARFNNNDSITIYAVYKSGSINKTARFIVSDSGSDGQIDYLALGDSYISGEGAFDYEGGTDTDTNKCHVSFLAYPFLLGHDLNYNSYHSVACSGATTDDIINTSDNYAGQADHKKIKRSERIDAEISSIFSSYKPGYIDQLDFVKTYQPKAITIAIGGNDMGFADILKVCASPSISNSTCYSSYEDRLELVRQINNTVFPRLVQTYQQLRTAGPPDMRIYVVGYPQIAKPGGNCALNVHLNNDEIIFSQELINYLDMVTQKAAAKAGVYYVDTQDALNGHRLCEAKPGSIAMNGLTAGNDPSG